MTAQSSNECKLTKKYGGDWVKKQVLRAQAGDADAFVELIEENKQSLYKIAVCYLKNTEDVADVIQDTILTVYEKIGECRQPRYFRTWLIRILINKCKDLLNQRERETVVEIIPESGYVDNQFDRMIYQEIIRAVDEKYRDILVLYYVEGFRTKEIAGMLNMNEATVRTRLRRGRGNLRQIYNRDFTEQGAGAGGAADSEKTFYRERMGKNYAG